jgi:antitoxin HicB
MARKNPHIGSNFESWLDDAGIREEVTAAATKAVIARHLASEMKKITWQRKAELMKASRAQVDRLLDSDTGSATIPASETGMSGNAWGRLGQGGFASPPTNRKLG